MKRNGLKGGEKVRRTCHNRHSNRLVYVRYRDHIQFHNTSPLPYFDVNVREAVGWLTCEEDEFLVLTSDRSAEPLPHEVRENFLIIIRSDILKMEKIK